MAERAMWLAARILRLAAAGVLLSATGCSGFFPPITTTPAPTPGTTSDYVYVANSTTNTIGGFAIATSTTGAGTLTALSGSPYSVPYQPTAMAVTPTNTFLYVSAGVLVYGYAIKTDGTLSAVSSGGPLAQTALGAVSLDVSPDGKWLFALGADGAQIYEYGINASTGVLTAQAPTIYTPKSGTVVPRTIQVAPSGLYVFVALGTGGDIVFPFTTSTGVVDTMSAQKLSTGSTTTSDNALVVDSGTNYAYIARSGASTGVAVYRIGSGGSLTSVAGSPFAAGGGPYAVQLDSTGKYLYAANRTDGTISGFSIGTGGVLTALASSPYASGLTVTSLARDSSGKYVLAAANGGSPDLMMYSFDSTAGGKLNSAATAATGMDPAGPVMVVATH